MLNNSIINKKFLLKNAVHVLTISFISLSPLACFIFMLLNTSRNADVSEIIDRAQKAVAVQENIIKSFMEYSRRADSGDILVAVDMVRKDHIQSMAAMNESILLLQDISRREREVMLIAVLIVITQFGLLLAYFFFKADKHIEDRILVPGHGDIQLSNKNSISGHMWCNNDFNK